VSSQAKDDGPVPLQTGFSKVGKRRDLKKKEDKPEETIPSFPQG
jgi:hypothetical protein